MAKLILLGILIYMTIVPVVLAQKPSPKRTMRSIQIMMFIGVIIWALACRRYYPQLVPVE
jgi:hypothetical protein